MSVSAQDVAQLRAITGISMGKCKTALEETGGDKEKAIAYLRKQGEVTADKRSDRETTQGAIITYVHDNKMGVILKLTCETDFVAKNADFINLGKDIAMHIVASNPLYISPEDIDQEEIKKEKEIYIAQLEKENKPEHILEKILEGKIKKFKEENALLTQSFVKNPDISVGELIKQAIAKMGENICVGDFKRMCI